MGLYAPYQTATASNCGPQNFSGKGINGLSAPADIRLKHTGPKATVNTNILVDPSGTKGCIFMQSENIGSGGASGVGEPGVVTWQAGSYVVRLNIITGNVQVKIDSVFIHATNGACSNIGLIGSLTGLAQLTTAGVHTFTITTVAATTVPENAQLYVTIALTNAAVMQQAIVILANQTITTPIMQPSLRTMLGAGV